MRTQPTDRVFHDVGGRLTNGGAEEKHADVDVHLGERPVDTLYGVTKEVRKLIVVWGVMALKINVVQLIDPHWLKFCSSMKLF